jgi:hypothetical protein
MVENTRTCLPCCEPPKVAVDASELSRRNNDLTNYIYVSTIQSVKPGFTYQFKSQTERIQALMGKLTTPQAVAGRSNGGQCYDSVNLNVT